MAGRADIQAGGAFVRLFLKDDMTKKLSRALARVGNATRDIGAKVSAIGAPVAAAGGAITAAMSGAVRHFAAVGDELDKMSQRTGIAAPELAGLGFAAEQSGAEMATVEKGVRRMQASILDLEQGLSTATASFGELGLSMADMQGLSPEDQFQLIADRLAAIEDPTRKAALAQEVFGRAGTQLIPMLNNLRELRQEAKDLGIIPSQEEVDNAAKVTDAINRVRRVVSRMVFSVGSSLAVPVLEMLEHVKNVGVSIGDWVKNNGELIRTVAKLGAGLLVAGSIIVAVGASIVGVGAVISGLASVVSGVAAAFGLLLSPIGLVTAATVAGVAVWVRYTESGQQMVATLSTAFGEILSTVKKVFGGIYDAVAAGDLVRAGQIAMAGLKAVFFQGLEVVRNLFGDTVANIAGDLLSGDFTQAWATVVDGMTLIWQSFATGVINTFAGAADFVVNAWQKATTAISNSILDAAAQEGFAGNIARMMLGVDMRDEQANASATEQARREVVKRNMKKTIGIQEQQLAEATAAGDQGEIASLTKALATSRAELAKLESTGIADGLPNLVNDAKQAASDILRAQADAARSSIQQVRDDAQARQDAAADRFVSQNEARKKALNESAAQNDFTLNTLVENAAREARKNEPSMLAEAGKFLEGLTLGSGIQTAAPSFQLGPTFSAAAAEAAGFTPAMSEAQRAEQQRQKQLQTLETIANTAGQTLSAIDRFLASFTVG